jgi:hypothetical protein
MMRPEVSKVIEAVRGLDTGRVVLELDDIFVELNVVAIEVVEIEELLDM